MAKFLKENFDKKEIFDFAKQRKPFQVQFGLKKHVKNTGILMAVYQYSVFAISIHSTFARSKISPLALPRSQELQPHSPSHLFGISSSEKLSPSASVIMTTTTLATCMFRGIDAA